MAIGSITLNSLLIILLLCSCNSCSNLGTGCAEVRRDECECNRDTSRRCEPEPENCERVRERECDRPCDRPCDREWNNNTWSRNFGGCDTCGCEERQNVK